MTDQDSYDQWWRAHSDEPPTVVIRCGRGGCRKTLGELKTDGINAFIMWFQRFGEATVNLPPQDPPNTSDPIRIRLHQRDSQQLRATNDGRRVTKRHRGEPLVQPLERLSTATCPVHGLIPIPYPFRAVNDLRAFVGDTKRGSKRTYLLFREEPLES